MFQDSGLPYDIALLRHRLRADAGAKPWHWARARLRARVFDLVGIVADDVHWRDGATGDGIGTGINVLRPDDVKGLEFDAVVVAEPERIVGEYDRGERLLYVALTRTTRHLTVVHVGAALPASSPPGEPHIDAAQPLLPEESWIPDRADALDPVSEAPMDPSRTPRTVELLAGSLATEVREGLPEGLWPQLLPAVQRRLDGTT